MKKLLLFFILFLFSTCISTTYSESGHSHKISTTINIESKPCYIGEKLGKKTRTYIQQFCLLCGGNNQIGEPVYGYWSDCTIPHYGGSDVKLLD